MFWRGPGSGNGAQRKLLLTHMLHYEQRSCSQGVWAGRHESCRRNQGKQPSGAQPGSTKCLPALTELTELTELIELTERTELMELAELTELTEVTELTELTELPTLTELTEL